MVLFLGLLWSWVNQGSSTVSVTNEGTQLYLSSSVVSGTHSIRALVIPTPTPPYEFETSVSLMNPATNVWDALSGIVIQESSSGKLMTCQLENDNIGGTSNFANFQFSSATYWSSPTQPVQDQVLDYYRIIGTSKDPRIRYGDDGTNRYCKLSMDDGNNWLTYVNQSRTLNLTADHIGFFADVYEGSNTSVWAAILQSWRRTI